jgi:hypothetical protein
MLTADEKRIAQIESRTLHADGKAIMSDRDFHVLLASRLAWRFTAKCFSADDDQVPPRWLRDEKTNELFERQKDGSYRAAYRLIPLAN